MKNHTARKSIRPARWLATAALATLGASSLAADPVSTITLADYHRLQEHLYTKAGTAIPPEGIVLRSDVATITLESGTVRFLEPLPGGLVTGLTFEGKGLFQLEVPDPVEREQLARKSGRGANGRLEEPFTEMILRTSEPFLSELFPARPDSGYERHAAAADRHQNWIQMRWIDVDARVVHGALSLGDEYLRLAILTPSFEWLTYEFDSSQPEEIELTRYDSKRGFTESWVSLDRAEDRDPRGRPRSELRPAFDVEHVDIRVDLTEAGSGGRVGLNRIQPREGKFVAAVDLVSSLDGPRSLTLELDVLCEVKAVRAADGSELPFLRDHIGKRSSILDNDLYDDSLVVLLPAPLARGERMRLVVEYQREVLNYLPGRGWYPGGPEGFHDPHTARIKVTALKKHDLRSMGRLIEEREEGGTRHATWEIETPVKMATFSFAERFHEETIELPGVPDVVAFAASSGGTAKNKTFNVAADVANSIAYFQQLFAAPLAVERLYATDIIGGHGQSFEGFLHLTQYTFEVESSGPTELFRAHEAAHQWWGHQVGWASYRDQWLSEAFAEYSAILFVEASMEKGAEYYDEIIRAYSEQTLGTMKKMSRFARGWTLTANDEHRQQIGPISTGHRAAAAQARGGYFAQSYVKGAVVLHMLRVMLRNLTQSDDLFIEVLREVVRSHAGGEASTDDFLAALTRKAPGDWGWFFDQWVHSANLPTYTWSYAVASRPDADGKFPLTLTIEQSGVAEGFRMPVPVEVDFGKGQVAQVVVLVDKPSETFVFPLPGKPRSVTLNPAYAVLAEVREAKKGR